MDEVQQAQKLLARSLERAKAGEDRDLATEIRETGERFVQLFYGALRMSRIHTEENRAFDRPVEEIRLALARLVELLGAIHVVAVGDQIYLNDIRLRIKSANAGASDLGEELRSHNVGGITFHHELDEQSLRRLISAFAAAPPPSRKRAAVAGRLAERQVRGVELTGVFRFRSAGDEESASRIASSKRSAIDVLARAAELVEETWDAVGSDRVLNVLPLRRVVSEMVGLDMNDPEWWRDPPGHTLHGPHAVRVCRLALLIAKTIGFGDALLQDLGVAALLHDVGYSWSGTTMELHPGLGAALMLRQRGFHEAKVRRVLTILQHHRNHLESPRPSLFARIVRIAEDYDNLSAGEGLRTSPAAVIAMMASEAGTAYDPILFHALVNRLGRYPVGTRLLLDDGRMMRVTSLARSEETWDRPAGMSITGEPVDLGQNRLEIVKVLPRKRGKGSVHPGA